MSKAASMAFKSLTIWKYGFIYTHVLDSFCLSSTLYLLSLRVLEKPCCSLKWWVY